MDSMVNAIVRSDVTEDGGEEFFVPVSDISEKIKRGNTFQDASVESNKEVTRLHMDVACLQVPPQLCKKKEGKMNFVHISHVYR